jgi:hypothetical protein
VLAVARYLVGVEVPGVKRALSTGGAAVLVLLGLGCGEDNRDGADAAAADASADRTMPIAPDVAESLDAAPSDAAARRRGSRADRSDWAR